jgi:hypothetical protein
MPLRRTVNGEITSGLEYLYSHPTAVMKAGVSVSANAVSHRIPAGWQGIGAQVTNRLLMEIR